MKGGAYLRPSRDVATSLPRDACTSTSLVPGMSRGRFFSHPSPVDGGRKDVFRQRGAATASLPPATRRTECKRLKHLHSVVWDRRDLGREGQFIVGRVGGGRYAYQHPPSFARNVVGSTSCLSGLLVGSVSSTIRIQNGVSGRVTVLTRIPNPESKTPLAPSTYILLRLTNSRNQTSLILNAWSARG